MGNIISLGDGSGVRKNKSKKSKIFIIITVIILAVPSVLLALKFINDANDDSADGKVLTVKDLENPSVDLSPDTSDDSVENLTDALQAKIDKQIVAKDNPIDTVKELAGVLSNTTNQKRQDQLTYFLEDFLKSSEHTLWYKYEGSKPDQAQVNYWKGELYAYLVYGLKSIMDNQFTDDDKKLIDTTESQLKYINLYLKLANDSDSHIAKSEQEKKLLIDYEYVEVSDFTEIKNDIIKGR